MAADDGRTRVLHYACAFAVAMVALSATPARAQIYSWRDVSGNLVLSNRKPAGPARTYAVLESPAVRTTRYAAVSRSRLYDDLIAEHAQENHVRTDLVRAVVQVESAFNPQARSAKGALGLMQLMPATIHDFGVKNPFDPAQNVRAGVAYLRQLLDRYQNNEELALAAYNAGPGAVDKHGQTIPPYRETRDYVQRINRMAGPSIGMRRTRIYKTVEIVDGRPIVRYTDKKPDSGSYEIVGSR